MSAESGAAPLAARTAASASAQASQCTSSTACLSVINNGTGKAIFGLGMQGNGVVGQTTGIGTGPSAMTAGVRGDELGLANFGAGVIGDSRGSWGVIGQALNDVGSAGIYGISAEAGVYADTELQRRHFEALFADGHGEAGIFAVSDGQAPTGIFEQDGSGDALDVQGRLVVNGDVTIGGSLITAGNCASACGSRKVALYASSYLEPAIEDAGEARLQDGRATVQLNPQFASAIDPSTYVVTITPEGESDGLYVASRGASAFTVRESHSGHSSIAFAYRITAHAYGKSSANQIHLISVPQKVTVLRPHPMQ
jgi:hypothetical protein